MGGDDGSAELGEHVGERGLGLGGVLGLAFALGGEVGRVVAVQGVSDDGDRVAAQAEPNGAAHGVLGTVAGLADAEQVAGLGQGDLDRPAPGVPADQSRRTAEQVVGDQRQVVACVGAVVAQQDHAHLPGLEGPVPQAADLGQVHGVGAAVPVDLCIPELRGGGESGGVAQSCAFQRRARPRLPVRGGARSYNTALAGR